ncbi:hypothetical protein AWB79_05985 [Caballeronia hypogeia]|uniref:8-amino-7-oxononanoate synthase n=1 Tax=Caballeronia hypogeia TaxID=1777140 RepID=A0A158CU24_9BURK|nr:8-amino-7-oxononanoate synthase [Caballeronia hypogeia]SAK85828.1 hypothetical protein AWB79_05985 [Caballeronia hypogeia]
MSTIPFPGVLQLKVDQDDPDNPGKFTVQIPVETLAATERSARGPLRRASQGALAPASALAGGPAVVRTITLSKNPDTTGGTGAGDLLLQLADAVRAIVTAATSQDEVMRIAAYLLSGDSVRLTGTYTPPADRAVVPSAAASAGGAPAGAPAVAQRIRTIGVGAPSLADPARADSTSLAVPDARGVASLQTDTLGVATPAPDPTGDAITDRSGVVGDDRMFGAVTPVSMRRSSLPLTADVALWILIKRNAELLSWENYTRNLDLLFFSSGTVDERPLYPGAARLSRRRFLPFTDTDAYRALKVATEAFVVTWGAVVHDGTDNAKVMALLQGDDRARLLANERLGLKLTDKDVKALAKMYLTEHQNLNESPSVPYLERIVSQLQGTGAGDIAQSAQDALVVQQRENPDFGPCHETCLWLTAWNNDISAKLMHPPLIELIWSYWMEELQLVQTMNAVSRRFQNISSGPRDPLAQLELDSLRPLNNLIWGWVQDEQHRLPIERRAAEYAHQYGLQLFGRAVPKMRTADNRSKFLEAFHTLLNQCVPFFRQSDDTTVVPDGFPILNALREVHLILSEGAHNQFLDLPTTSRIEMMMQQWLLARPEFREYLPRRAMVAYPEPWMHSVESMRKLQGWGDTNTFQFWQLATMGEQIVSSIRWGDWNSINDPANAANWATFFRPEIQAYIHSYRAVTGVDVSAEPVDVQVPGIHLLRRLRERRNNLAA